MFEMLFIFMGLTYSTIGTNFTIDIKPIQNLKNSSNHNIMHQYDGIQNNLLYIDNLNKKFIDSLKRYSEVEKSPDSFLKPVLKEPLQPDFNATQILQNLIQTLVKKIVDNKSGKSNDLKEVIKIEGMALVRKIVNNVRKDHFVSTNDSFIYNEEGNANKDITEEPVTEENRADIVYSYDYNSKTDLNNKLKEELKENITKLNDIKLNNSISVGSFDLQGNLNAMDGDKTANESQEITNGVSNLRVYMFNICSVLILSFFVSLIR